jgi:hypothetical protein
MDLHLNSETQGWVYPRLGIGGRLFLGFYLKICDAIEKNVLDEENVLRILGLFQALHGAAQKGEQVIGGERLVCSMIGHLSRPFGSDFGVLMRRCLDRGLQCAVAEALEVQRLRVFGLPWQVNLYAQGSLAAR